jgi:hypothetical protein
MSRCSTQHLPGDRRAAPGTDRCAGSSDLFAAALRRCPMAQQKETIYAAGVANSEMCSVTQSLAERGGWPVRSKTVREGTAYTLLRVRASDPQTDVDEQFGWPARLQHCALLAVGSRVIRTTRPPAIGKAQMMLSHNRNADIDVFGDEVWTRPSRLALLAVAACNDAFAYGSRSGRRGKFDRSAVIGALGHLCKVIRQEKTDNPHPILVRIGK